MKYNKKILPNGLRIVTIPMVDNPAVTVFVMVEAGSEYENKEVNGLSHFLEHMVFKGTPKRPKAIEVSRELDSIGAEYNAFTSQQYTAYYAKVAVKHFDTALDVVADMYLNPLFEQSEIEKEKGVIIEEIKMYKDLPHKHVHDVFGELMYGDTPAGWSVLGDEKNIKAMSREDFLEYRKNHYVASATTVVVAGGINEDETIRKIEEKFLQISTGNKKGKRDVLQIQSKPQVRVDYKNTDQTHLVLGLSTFSIFDKRLPVMKVLTGVLSGGMSARLFSKMRDELGICYYVNASQNSYTDHGDFTISAGVDNKRVEEAITEILKELKRLKDEKVSDDELKKVKDCMIGGMLLGLETSDDQAEYIGFQELLKREIEVPDQKIAKINSVTVDQIQKLAQEIFVDEKLNLAIIGPYKDEEDRFIKILHFNHSNEHKNE